MFLVTFRAIAESVHKVQSNWSASAAAAAAIIAINQCTTELESNTQNTINK